jgi:hypothetical protein
MKKPHTFVGGERCVRHLSSLRWAGMQPRKTPAPAVDGQALVLLLGSLNVASQEQWTVKVQLGNQEGVAVAREQ